MAKLFLSLLIGLLFVVQGWSQVKSAPPIWADYIDINQIPEVNKKQVKNGYYYLLSDEQNNTTARQTYFHYALTAVSEEGLTQVSQLEFTFDPQYQRGFVHSVAVHRGGKVIDKTKDTRWQELKEENERNQGLLNGYKTLYANLTDIRKGDIVEYSYSIVGRNPVFKDYFGYTLWFGASSPIGKIYSKVILPNGEKPNIRFENGAPQPVVRIKDFTEYIWDISNPVVIREEESLPSWQVLSPCVQLSNLNNWNEVKEHCREMLNVKEPSQKDLQFVIDSLIVPSMTLEQKITALISFVQLHIRYSGNESGIYSHVPRDPVQVLRNRYGDCKEKSVLLCSMLKYAGLEAYPVLVNTSFARKIKDQNPRINIFDHCIACFRYQGQYFFVDPTITYQRGDFRDRQIPSYECGMVLDKSPKAFEDIPVCLNNRIEVLEEFTVLESGDAKLKVITHGRGYAADEMRYLFMTKSIADIQESYRTYYNKYSDDVDVLDTLIFEDYEEKNEATITEYYQLNGFWKLKDVSGSKNIERDFAPYSLNSRLTRPSESERKMPLAITYPIEYFQEIKINHTSNWNVEDDLKECDNPFFSYSYKTHADGSCLSLSYHYTSKTDVVNPEDYAEYKSQMEFVDYNMIFNATQTPARDYSGFNWTLLLAIFVGLGGTGLLVFKLYKRPYMAQYKNEYERIGGWLVLMAIGIALSPLGLLISLIRQYAGEMSIDYTAFYFDVESDYFSPLKGYYELTIACFNSGFLVFTIFLVVLFFQHKASFRPYFVIFRIFNVVFLILNTIVLYALSDSGNVQDRASIMSTSSSLVSFVIVSAIWVPYIWYSDRSRYTFTVSQNITEAPPADENAPLA